MFPDNRNEKYLSDIEYQLNLFKIEKLLKNDSRTVRKLNKLLNQIDIQKNQNILKLLLCLHAPGNPDEEEISFRTLEEEEDVEIYLRPLIVFNSCQLLELFPNNEQNPYIDTKLFELDPLDEAEIVMSAKHDFDILFNKTKHYEILPPREQICYEEKTEVLIPKQNVWDLLFAPKYVGVNPWDVISDNEVTYLNKENLGTILEPENMIYRYLEDLNSSKTLPENDQYEVIEEETMISYLVYLLGLYDANSFNLITRRSIKNKKGEKGRKSTVV